MSNKPVKNTRKNTAPKKRKGASVPRPAAPINREKTPAVSVVADLTGDQVLGPEETPTISVLGVDLEIEQNLASFACYQRVLEKHFDNDPDGLCSLDENLAQIYSMTEIARRSVGDRLDVPTELKKRLRRMGWLEFLQVFTLKDLQESMGKLQVEDSGNDEAEEERI